MRVMTSQIGLRRPGIVVITRRKGGRTCRIEHGKFTRTRNSLKSQFVIMILPISCVLSHSHLQLYDHLKS
jgi:hypothetical protein